MATVLLSISTNTLCGIYVSPDLGALSSLAEHSASPVPLTERGPLGDNIHCFGFKEASQTLCTFKV
jgi:hypothetical protein